MFSMSLGMVADFDEAAGDYGAARRALEQAIATNDSLGMRSFTSSLVARLGWVLLHLGDVDGAEHAYGRALEEGRRLQHTQSTFVSQAGMAVVHRLRRRDREAFEAATEAVELFAAGTGLRFRNRVDPRKDLLAAAAAAYSVLAELAAERGDTGQAEQLSADAAALGQPTPPFLAQGVQR
jgi:tetratricopeptide (TPR) repeat protein